jgi:hypothetical protein
VDVIDENMVVVLATHSVDMNIERMCTQKVLTSQVVGMVNMNEVYVDVIDENMVVVLATHSVNMNIEQMCAQKVLTSQVVGMVNMNEVYMDVDAIMNNMQEKPETRDVVNNTNPEGKHNNEKTMEEQVHEKPEERDGASSSSFTYHTRQSSTKTEAVLRYVDSPILNQLVQFVTPLSNTGPLKPEKRDVMININRESRYDDEEMVEKQVD